MGLNEAWMAGLFDGDGFLGIYKVNGIYKTQAGVVNIDRRALEIFWKRYGGCILSRKQDYPTHQKRFDWRVSGKAMQKCLQNILPYLVIKRKRAEIALEFLSLVGTNGSNGRGRGRKSLDINEIERRDKLIAQLKSLQSHQCGSGQSA